MIRSAAWPLIIGACFAAVVIAPTPLVTALVVGGAGLAVLSLERAIPFRAAWRPTRRDWLQGLAYVALSTAVAGGLQWLLAHGARPPASYASRAAWIAGGIVAMDLAAYLVHRALHRVRFLWPIHAVHHGLPRVWFLNALHNHALDIALSTLAGLVPLLVLRVPAELVGAIGAVSVGCFWFQHANADLRLGWLNRVISGPELHRWHHSLDKREADANYGMVLAIWDVLFGSWRAPGAPSAIGVEDAPPMRTLAEQALAPFRYDARM